MQIGGRNRDATTSSRLLEEARLKARSECRRWVIVTNTNKVIALRSITKYLFINFVKYKFESFVWSTDISNILQTSYQYFDFNIVKVSHIHFKYFTFLDHYFDMWVDLFFFLNHIVYASAHIHLILRNRIGESNDRNGSHYDYYS